MQILLGSGGFGTQERRERFLNAYREHLDGVERVLFVPYALDDHARYLELMREHFSGGIALEGLHEAADERAAVESAQAIYVGGGNSFRLVYELYRRELMQPIRDAVAAGAPYIGVSAGSNVACPTLCTTNDMPIVQPPSFDTLGLVPFQINPHYYPGNVFVQRGDERVEHRGETRDERIAEYHERNERVVVGLYEGAWLRCADGKVLLDGGPARLFRRGEEAVELEAPAELRL